LKQVIVKMNVDLQMYLLNQKYNTKTIEKNNLTRQKISF